MGFGSSIVKYLVFIFNLIFALAGLVLLVVGVLFKINFNDMDDALESSPMAVAPTLVIVISAIIFVIAFFGCCGAIRESTCMLTSYAVLLLSILILQVALGVYVLIKIKDENGLRNGIEKDLTNSFNKVKEGDTVAQESFELIQSSLKCCGVRGSVDWINTWRFPGFLPPSCCEGSASTCSIINGYGVGCSKKVYTTVIDNASTIGYVAIGLCATELIAAIVSLCLQSSIKNERRRDGFY